MVYGHHSLPDSQRRKCGRGGGWEANDAVPPPCGVGRDSDIYIRVQRVLLLNVTCKNYMNDFIMKYTCDFLVLIVVVKLFHYFF